MIKTIHYIFALFAISLSYGQKTYKFDYVLEYELEYDAETGKVHSHKYYYFINSADNSAMFLVSEDNDEVRMRLQTEKGKFYYSTMPREDFFVEAISLKCPGSGSFPNEPKLSDYEVKVAADTVINTQRYKHRVLKPEKDKLPTEHYIIESNPLFSNPVLAPFELGFRFWKKGANIPAGLLKEWYSQDNEGKITAKLKLLQFIKLKKIIMVDKNCK
jgi:hypothetical protein